MRIAGCLLTTVAVLAPRGALAHDMWLEPERFSVESKGELAVRLKVGSGTDVKTVARQPARVVRLESVGPRAHPIDGKPGADPIGSLRLGAIEPGSHLLVYQSNHAYIELPPAEFESYLEHEGLSDILAERKATSTDGRPGTESYARACKALLTVDGDPIGYDRVLGLPLELIPVEDPRQAKRPVVFRLLSMGRPLAGARVDLMPLEDLTRSTAKVTDERGVVRFEAPSPGRFMVATTHMAPAKPPVKGDWESQWATFAFEISATETRSRAPPREP